MLYDMAHLIDRDAPDPLCPIIGRTEWFRDTFYNKFCNLTKIIPETVIKRIGFTEPILH